MYEKFSRKSLCIKFSKNFLRPKNSVENFYEKKFSRKFLLIKKKVSCVPKIQLKVSMYENSVESLLRTKNSVESFYVSKIQ